MKSEAALRTRLAPTPSGLLHPGNGLSFVLTWVIARANGGQVLLRIDDLDKARCKEEYIEDVFYTLEWLGIDYDEGPSGVDDFHENWSQHNRLDRYSDALNVLRKNEQLFACDCTRKSIRAISSDGHYPNTCLDKALDFEASDVSWRVKPGLSNIELKLRTWENAPTTISLKDINAFIVKQKNGFPAYQLASLIDDQLYNINFIVRGEDLWGSTLSQLYLAYLLDHTAFLNTTFWHHPLIVDKKGEKLSKSKGAGSLQSWRTSGRTPGKIYRWAIQHLALPPNTPLHPHGLTMALKERID
jgi:glutamyl/glutaminyl-tRNA synthetase